MESLKSAVEKITLTPEKQQTTSLQLIKKSEPVPKCVTAGESLIGFYNKTDLEFKYVYEQCLILVPLKGIEINRQMIEFWFREFIKAGWNKKWFGKQLKAVKQRKLFNRLDIADWFEAEIMYTELDFNIMVDRKIARLLQRGEFLKNHPEVELSDEDKKCVELELAQEQIFKSSADYYANRESYKEEQKRKFNERFQ